MSVFSLLLVGSALASEVSEVEAQAQVTRIEAHYSTIQTLQAGFTQTVHSTLYGAQIQTGTVTFGRPGRMNWTFDKENKRYVSDGQTLWVVLSEDKQAFRYPGYDPSGSAESLLHSLDNLTLLFDVQVTSHGEQGTELRLQPKQAAGYSSVLLTLEPDLDVARVVVTDTMETRTELVFSDMKTNVEVPQTLFSYVPEPGVEVIDAGKGP